MSTFFPSSQQKTIVNAMAVNDEGVMVTGGEKQLMSPPYSPIPLIFCSASSPLLATFLFWFLSWRSMMYCASPCVGDNGSMWFWDWKSGHNFQQSQTIVQPGMCVDKLMFTFIVDFITRSKRFILVLTMFQGHWTVRLAFMPSPTTQPAQG